MLLKQGEKATVLKEVVVTARKDRFINGGVPGRNECGDYVCQFQILNCPNHSFGTIPVEGHYYTSGGMRVRYAGCVLSQKQNQFIIFLKGIYQAKEFYQEDYGTISPSVQMYLPTIFWKYSVSVHSDKAIELSFYTSDIVGKYRVIVQGVTTAGVVHGEYVFNVVK